jgi:3-dehydroquinate dehydratase-1
MPRLGDIDLGPVPRIIAAATDRDFAHTGWAALADGIELRVDQFDDPTPAGARAACDAARRLDRPIIGTVRSATEGGAGGLSDSQRRSLYAALAAWVDGLDVELRSPLCDEVVAEARRHDRLAIVSAHYFDATPPDAVLAALLAEGGRRGDVVKIAAATAGPADLARLLDLLRRPGPPRIVIGMGAEGAASRVFFPLLGSLLTYSFAGAPTAPGQLGLAALYDALRQYSPAFAANHPPR